MSNAESYKPLSAAAADAPAVVSVLANKLLAKKEALDGHERFGDVDEAVLRNVQRRGDFSILVYAEGSAQIDKGSKERPNLPLAAVLAEAVVAVFDKLPKSAQSKIIDRAAEIATKVREADSAGETLPVKSNDKLISLAQTVAPDVAELAKERLSERDKSPSIRTTGTAYILSAELGGGRVAAAISPGNETLQTVADIVANDRKVAEEFGITAATARRIARQVKEARARTE
jgi:hypothetical protein